MEEKSKLEDQYKMTNYYFNKMCKRKTQQYNYLKYQFMSISESQRKKKKKNNTKKYSK